MNQLTKISNDLLERMECKQKEDDSWFYCFNSDYIMSDNDSLYSMLSDVLHSINAGESFKYKTIYEFLEWIQESEFECIEDVQDSIFEFCDYQTPVYTSDLTGWLSESNYHVYWLEDAAQRHGQTDGFSILSSAYYLAVEEIAYELVSVIDELLEYREV